MTGKINLLLRTVVGLVLIGASVLNGVTPAAAAVTCAQRTLVVVAHEDDDLLFMNPDIQHDLAAGVCVTTVFLTAGDDGLSADYWLGREAGSQSAHDTMLGAPSTWMMSQRSFAGHSVHTATSSGGAIDLIYLRLPDGSIPGTGFSATGYQSLSQLYSGSISSIRAVDASATYSRTDLIATLAAIVTATGPSVVRVQDGRSGQDDHSDHQTGARFAREALLGYTGTVTAYRGYGVVNDPANVSGNDLSLKTNAVVSYAAHDELLCSDLSNCPQGAAAEWTQRQYTAPLTWNLTPVAGPAPYSGPDVARNASVLASSQVVGQEATKAIDGVVSGYPANAAAEWSSDGQGSGAWIQLYWSSAQTIDRVYLYDRPSGSEQVTGGLLTFSDGSSVSVPSLNNDGSATVVTFAARSVTMLQFTVTSVSATTGHVGLAELEAYNGDPNPALAVPGPAPYSGPDVARNASVLASSQVVGQEATKAIDGVVSGYPANAAAEWSSAGQGSGAWIQLYWSSAQTIDRVYLYDRPSGSEQVTGGTLTFSDGSSVSVSSLNNDGSATVVTFAARSVTMLRFTVTSVSATTGHVGLAELEAYNGDPNPALAVPGPAPYSGPDVARNASVLASSQVVGQEATKAIDGVVSGYPANAAAEWSSDGQGSGAWIQLYWSSAQTIDRVYLYDRPSGSEQVTGGLLTFSDGSSVSVPSLNNDGSATVVTFAARSVTMLQFTVTSVSATTGHVGLAELEAYNGDPGPALAVPGPAPYSGPDVARNASVLASSQVVGQEATKAIDGVVSGYPDNPGAEWSSAGQGSGAWIQLYWSSAQTIDRVYLYDRPSGSEQVTGGTLTFSDGSSVSVSSLNNDGSATMVTFAARSVTTLRFTVTSVSATTGHVGLAELEAYNGDPNPALAVPGPAPYSGPDVARNASVLVSSQVVGQEATKAIDGVVSGYPDNPGAEWSSAGQGSGAWIQLYWSSAQTIDRVYLYDRPSGSEQVTGGTLTFSDGSSVSVPSLNNDGSATIVTFAARSVTTLRFTVTSVSATTGHVGLAELEAYNGDPNPALAVPSVARTVTLASGASGVAVTSVVAVTFSGSLNAASVSIALTGPGGTTVPGALATAASSVTFTPAAALAGNTTYTVTVNAAGPSGTAMAPFTSTFTTEAPVTMATTTPAANATGVAVASTIGVTFAGSLAPSSVAITLAPSGGTAVAGVLTTTATSAMFSPAAALAESTVYTATVTASSGSGAAMAPYTWTFSTVSPAPVVASRTPASAATGVAVNSPVQVTFTKAGDPTKSTLSLVNASGVAVAGTVATTSTTVTFTPSALLAANTNYTATVGASSLLGTAMTPAAWSFTTETAPRVSAITPANGATGVTNTTTVRATFSKAVNPASIVIVLADPSGTAVSGTLVTTTTTGTLTPSAILKPGTVYRVTVNAALTDGLAATTFTSSFTTGAAVNIFPAALTPVSSTTSPTPLTVGVKFRSTTAYMITGIRFYLPANVTSTYTVTLWSSNGTKLATASGSPTSATAGWRTVNLTTPVRITANTTYVASVRALTAQYSSTPLAFLLQYTRGPFTVPAAGGVTSSNDLFPTATSTTNYFVDVVAAP